MNTSQRRTNIEIFVESQKHYLAGLRYRVVIDEAKDLCYIEFESITENQYEQLRIQLKNNMMRHIEVRVLKWLQSRPRPNRSRNRKHKSNGPD